MDTAHTLFGYSRFVKHRAGAMGWVYFPYTAYANYQPVTSTE
jgi:hypothetical protein